MMRKRILVLFLVGICPLFALARAVRVLDMKDLIAGAKLVFVGKVLSVEPSDITTWHGAHFEWLKVEVEVLEPVKGVEKGDHVHTLMLGTRGEGPMMNAPGMVEPEKGKVYLLCLLPTTISNVYASLTAPWDDDQGIFLLDRASIPFPRATVYKDGKKVGPRVLNEKNLLLWDLIDYEGRVQPNNVAEMRKQYTDDINKVPGTNAIIHLQWETRQTASGRRQLTSPRRISTFPKGPITSWTNTFPGGPSKKDQDAEQTPAGDSLKLAPEE